MGWPRADLATLATLGHAAARALGQASPAEPGAALPAGSWNVECARCGTVAASLAALACGCGAGVRPSLLPAQLHGKFTVEQRIGAGGMGVVYRGRDMTLGRRVALKTLPALEPGAAARMADEARAMATVLHPNLGLIFGAEIWQRTPVLLIELLEGGTLADRLSRAPLPADEAVSLTMTLCKAVAALHAEGLLHGDIKPSNIGFTRGGTPKLLDFGLARLLSATPLAVDAATDGDSVSAIGGTPLYLRPRHSKGRARRRPSTCGRSQSSCSRASRDGIRSPRPE